MLITLARPVFLASATAALAACLAIAVPSASAATGSGATFGPDAPATELHVRTTDDMGDGVTTTSLHWRLGGRFRSVELAQGTSGGGPGAAYTIDTARGTSLYGSGRPGALKEVGVTRHEADVAPDGYDPFDAHLLGYGWPLVARQRSGQPALVPVTVGGRRLLRGIVALQANECAGLVRGVRTVDLDPATLVPVHVLDRRGRKITMDLRGVLLAARTTDFATVKVIGTRSVRDDGFVRRTPAQAAAVLAFPVSTPSVLPEGYRLDWSGSAKLGNMVGPEASFPRSAGVFFARYGRGIESLDFTIRGAAGTLARDWDQSDPFGGECEGATTTNVRLDAKTVAHYAIGEFGEPRLWWRNGTTLSALAGPHSAAQLAAVARSLVRVGD